MIASLNCKFKTNQKNIEKILQHYGHRKIQSSLYAGDLIMMNTKIYVKIYQKSFRKDNVLIIPVCESCFSKKEISARKIKFRMTFLGCIE